MSDLPEDWDPEAAFKRVADRRGLTVEELRAELAKRAKEYMDSVSQRGSDFCRSCGASIPHRPGEGRCPDCMEHLPKSGVCR